MSTTWLDEVSQKPLFPSLRANIEADVCIVGGGLCGVLTAYLLSKSNKKVVLVEKNKIGEGTTGYTTAFLTYVIDPNLVDLRETFGDKGAKLIWESHKGAIDLIEWIAKDENIKCEFKRCPAYYFTTKNLDFGDLDVDANIAASYGFDITAKKDKNLPFNNSGYVDIPNQAKFQPVTFVKQLSKICAKNSVQIFEDTEVLEIEGNKITTSNGQINASNIVIDTYTPFESPTAEIQAKLIAYQSYVIEAETSEKFEEALYWDTSDPYYYLRVDKKNNKTRLILGGLDHKTGEQVPKQPYKNLEKYLNDLLGIKSKVTKTWTAQVLETTDGIAVIGKSLVRKDQYFSTGFSGNGMTYSAISAQIITDDILEKENKYSAIYSPTRFKKPTNIFGQQVNYAKRMITDYLIFDYPEQSINKIPKDSGKVLLIDGKKVAVYKSKSGQLSKLSPVCTHLKCIVAWNDVDKSWDCPCHGSRFTKEGEVLNGPAKIPLSKL